MVVLSLFPVCKVCVPCLLDVVHATLHFSVVVHVGAEAGVTQTNTKQKI